MKITFTDFKKTFEIILTIEKDPSAIKVSELKKQISQQYQVKYTDISFIYNGYKINDNSTLKQINYNEEMYIIATIKMHKIIH